MSFLNPLFLLGALALAGPLILHLLLRDQARRCQLPTLRFLPSSSPQSMARQRIKNILLLLARLAILLLAVFAFARPYLKRPASTNQPQLTDEGAVFALDRSLSMRAGGRWDEAAG